MKHVKIIALLLILIAFLAVTGCCCICGCPSTGPSHGYKQPGGKCPCNKCPMGGRHHGCIDSISIYDDGNCSRSDGGDWHYTPG